ncbi:hypothetical protein ACWEWI_16195 [Streptomyces sp. NPDC003753]|nr:hypothetical protein [Streptomyces sp. Y2F8-2]
MTSSTTTATTRPTPVRLPAADETCAKAVGEPDGRSSRRPQLTSGKSIR